MKVEGEKGGSNETLSFFSLSLSSLYFFSHGSREKERERDGERKKEAYGKKMLRIDEDEDQHDVDCFKGEKKKNNGLFQ